MRERRTRTSWSVRRWLFGGGFVVMMAAQWSGVAPAAGPDGAVGGQGAAAEAMELGEWGQPKGQYLLREGKKLEVEVGAFRIEGGRLRFYPRDLKVQLTVLENSASGEVVRTHEQGGEGTVWEVSGTITEFREANYILISKASARAETAE